MSAPELIIRNAEFNDGERAGTFDLLVADGEVLDLLPAGSDAGACEGCESVDATGLRLLPSLVDAHVHLREPGQEYKESIETGLKAAAHGGFGSVMAMANTDPVNDCAAVTETMLERAYRTHPEGPHLLPVGALTVGLKGRELAMMGEMAEAGCVAFSNDGMPVPDSDLFRRGVEYAAGLGMRVIDHCEDPYLAGMTEGRQRGVMNEGDTSGRLGLKGIPTVAESMQVARDILLAEYLGLPIHLAHISCRESVELIAEAKRKGIPITAETCPHYLLFTDAACENYNTAAKVNPPLRTVDDVQAMRQAVREGVIDMLITDHAPHASHEKEVPFDEAPFGISGLDTALSLTWKLVRDNVLEESVIHRAWCAAPGEVFDIAVNRFRPGDPADFVLFDAAENWTVTPQAMHSKGKNTPAMGLELPGRVKAHYMAGRRIV